MSILRRGSGSGSGSGSGRRPTAAGVAAVTGGGCPDRSCRCTARSRSAESDRSGRCRPLQIRNEPEQRRITLMNGPAQLDYTGRRIGSTGRRVDVAVCAGRTVVGKKSSDSKQSNNMTRGSPREAAPVSSVFFLCACSTATSGGSGGGGGGGCGSGSG